MQNDCNYLIYITSYNSFAPGHQILSDILRQSCIIFPAVPEEGEAELSARRLQQPLGPVHPRQLQSQRCRHLYVLQ